MKHIALLALALSIFSTTTLGAETLSAGPPPATELWRGAHVGAPLDQILEQFPEATEETATPTTPFAPKTKARLEGFLIQGKPFGVEFNFSDTPSGQGLTSMRLFSTEDMRKKHIRQICEKLNNQFETEFGSPVSSNKANSIFAKESVSEYVAAPLKVSLRCATRAIDDKNIVIDYRVPDSFSSARSPHGIYQGMSLGELRAALPEAFITEYQDRTEGFAIYDVFLESAVDPLELDAVRLKIRLNTQTGVCALAATAKLPQGFHDQTVSIMQRIMPDRDIYGTPDSTKDTFLKPSHAPIIMPGFMMAGRPSTPKIATTWLSTESDPLPGQVDQIEHLLAMYSDNEGDDHTIMRTKYRFENYRDCALKHQWEAF